MKRWTRIAHGWATHKGRGRDGDRSGRPPNRTQPVQGLRPRAGGRCSSSLVHSTDSIRRQGLTEGGLILGLAAPVGVGLWQTSRSQSARWTAAAKHPERIMGTRCVLAAVSQTKGRAQADRVIGEAGRPHRRTEAQMNGWLPHSEVSPLNSAEEGEEAPVSWDTLGVLRAARRASHVEGPVPRGQGDALCTAWCDLRQHRQIRVHRDGEQEEEKREGGRGTDAIDDGYAGHGRRSDQYEHQCQQRRACQEKGLAPPQSPAGG